MGKVIPLVKSVMIILKKVDNINFSLYNEIRLKMGKSYVRV